MKGLITHTMKTIDAKITFTEQVLGTSPNDEDIYRNFIGSKAPDAQTVDEEVESLGVDAVVEKGMTVFSRDPDGNPALYDYQVKGFFKDTCSMLKKATGSMSKDIKAHKKMIDGLIFVNPRLITLKLPDGEKIGVCQRPLRAQTAQGERVALAMSESVPAGTWMEVEITCLTDGDEKYVREWLDYGKWRGIGQWRNASNGRFVWEELRCY